MNTTLISILPLLENKTFYIWLDKEQKTNHLLINKELIKTFYNLIQKLHPFNNLLTIIDSSAFCFSNKNLLVDLLKKNKFLFDTKYILFYNISNKHNLLNLYIPLKFNEKFYSLEKLQKSQSWSERETMEMFGIESLDIIDSRKLLLDYSLKIKPLIKDNDGILVDTSPIYYNINKEKILNSKNSGVLF